MNVHCVKCDIIALEPKGRNVFRRKSLNEIGWQSVLIGMDEYWMCPACFKRYTKKAETLIERAERLRGKEKK